jgi:hypothetical protein
MNIVIRSFGKNTTFIFGGIFLVTAYFATAYVFYDGFFGATDDTKCVRRVLIGFLV